MSFKGVEPSKEFKTKLSEVMSMISQEVQRVHKEEGIPLNVVSFITNVNALTMQFSSQLMQLTLISQNMAAEKATEMMEKMQKITDKEKKDMSSP